MKSLAVSVGFPSPRTQYQQANTYYLTQKNLEKKDNDLHLLAVGAKHNDLIASHTLPASSFLEHATQLDVVGRRDVIKGGAFIGILASILVSSEFAEASCDFTSSPSGLAFCDQIVGTGPQASKGQLIKAHYTGKLENGKVFDSSYNRGKPLTFRVGAQEVIKGWDEGILGSEGVPPMLAGGKRTLRIPPELGYGMRGAGCKGGTCIIPPNSVLLFEVEFLGKV
ncbi:peptidyl-prolyl cis-trans isomerase FKBP13, chloroplastic [Beta vulgaris subsp. vulgaris]|uniref:peptidyl-prolyl cis-trans isomerase FKBP13, chloroplastic n=1 Tax=Beta vulgaris subsp. vulgaris TaxID=3555 RepID=UPI0020375B64|nr:peptidyl-prolyl cis-trans isomerase FKBP13, chloroplastic [Beta vulgaris subsp. vulgaris]